CRQCGGSGRLPTQGARDAHRPQGGTPIAAALVAGAMSEPEVRQRVRAAVRARHDVVEGWPERMLQRGVDRARGREGVSADRAAAALVMQQALTPCRTGLGVAEGVPAHALGLASPDVAAVEQLLLDERDGVLAAPLRGSTL